MPVSNPNPTTELEAVNIMLSVIGEAPVNSLDDQLVVDAVMAKDILTEVSKEVQSEGWHFNTEIDYPLARNMSGEIILPNNCLRVDTDINKYPNVDVTQRGKRLYDRINHTYKWDSTINVMMVVALPFDELPEAARRYIMIKAARIFQDRLVGSETLHGFNAQDEARARSTLVETETENADRTILDGTTQMVLMLRR